jgi:hypothetical protein
VSDGAGKVYYFDYSIRKRIIAKELPYDSTDSHTSIADFYGFKGADEDMLNKYEYNPLTGSFVIDKMNNKDDLAQVKAFCQRINWKDIVPELIIKPIVHPFRDIQAGEVTDREIDLFDKWIAVWDSVRASVGDSVWDSVWDSVSASVGASVSASVRASVGDSVRASVWASVGAYTSSFFNLPNWKYMDHEAGINPFQPCIDLWESGFVPSFDGKVWRLHAGKEAKVVYERGI